jgi:hypothetical protein
MKPGDEERLRRLKDWQITIAPSAVGEVDQFWTGERRDLARLVAYVDELQTQHGPEIAQTITADFLACTHSPEELVPAFAAALSKLAERKGKDG